MNLNLLQQVIEAPRLKRYANPRITRSGLSTNPLQRYSFTGGDIYKIDDLVTLNGKITETAKSKTYDFANKVAGTFDLVNCPMELYYSTTPSLQVPSNITSSASTGFVKYGTQSGFNNLKNVDAQNFFLSSASTNIAQIMVELDLTTLANELGGNAKLKEALTGITVDAWAMGSGSNGGVLGNGVKVTPWVISVSQWDGYSPQNTTNSITKCTVSAVSNSYLSNIINSSNKLYVLIASQFASDGVLASSVSLDYISIKIDYKQRTVVNDGAFFIGGDTATYEFDMGLKVAGSVSECPVKMYARANATLYVPSDFPSYELNTQSDIDKVKTNDAVPLSKSNNGSGNIIQLMLELDLTPLCNSLFGGSNSALKAALKSITCDVWAQGSGASGGVLTNGVNTQLWNANSSYWHSSSTGSQGVSWQQSTSASIAKMTFSRNTLVDQIVSSSNKLYILIASQYASDSVIPSQVQLDYFNIKIDIARTPDTVNPIQVNLPKYWAMVVRGVSPSWTTYSSSFKLGFIIKNGTNVFRLKLDSNGYISFQKYFNGTWYSVQSTNSISVKSQVMNILLEQTASSMTIRALKNNDIVTKNTLADTNLIYGTSSLNLLSDYNTYQADAFAESFHLVDLQRIGRPNGFTDAEAEGILRGMVKGKNLINKAKLVLGDMNSANGADMASSTWLRHNEYIKCSPNTDYIRTSPSSSFVTWYDINKNYIGLYSNNPRVTSPVNAEYMRWSFAGTDTNAQIMVEQSSTATAYEPYMENPLGITNPELFDINAVTLHANATRSGNTITLNATGNWQTSTIDIPVLPNNQYQISVKSMTESAGYADILVKEQYNNVPIITTAEVRTATGLSKIFTTKSNTNKIRLDITASITGTFTFSDISLKLKM